MSATEIHITINAHLETAIDSGDQTTYNLHGKDAQVSPVPLVYRNGVLVLVADYTFNYGDPTTIATIVFGAPQSVSDVITCSYSWQLPDADSEDVSVFEFDKTINNRSVKDANGHDLVVESIAKVGSFRGVLSWLYMPQEFWEEFRIISENIGYTFDIVRVSLAAPFASITNLCIMKFPPYTGIPFMPGLADMTVEIQQLDVV